MTRRFGVSFVTKHGQRRQRKKSAVNIASIMFGYHPADKPTFPSAVLCDRVKLDTLNHVCASVGEPKLFSTPRADNQLPLLHGLDISGKIDA